MTDVFAAYGHKATTNTAVPLVGVMKLRSEARIRYSAIVAELHACASVADVERVLATHAAEIAQYAAELEFLWIGDGDFSGLEREIAWATARVDDRLDMPRWEPAGNQEEGTVQ